jgi:hypothetical protein
MRRDKTKSAFSGFLRAMRRLGAGEPDEPETPEGKHAKDSPSGVKSGDPSHRLRREGRRA